MTTASTFVLFAITGALAAAQTPAPTPPVPQMHATTTAGCVAEVRDYGNVVRRALTSPASGAQTQRINTSMTAAAAQCALQFDPSSVAEKDLANLVILDDLAGTVGDPHALASRRAAVDRALAVMTMAPADRAEMLVSALAIVRRFPPPAAGGRDARRAEMYPLLERIADELDASPAATFDQKFDMHRSLLGAYRGDDIDTGIIKHATWMVDAIKGFSAEQRAEYGVALSFPYIDMSESWAGQGMTGKAIDLLHTGETTLVDVPRVGEEIDPEIARLELVGKAAPAVTAPQWLNAPAGTKDMPMTGHVTLLEFTAHWCGPCRESYPGLNRLRARFGTQGFRVVLATQYWGYFSQNGKLERPLAADVEFDRDKTYFAEYHLDVPIAIGDQVHEKVVGGKLVVDPPGPDPNDTHYQVTGIPQIQIIDKHGIVRRILIGYDNVNETKLGEFIQQLLAEK